MLKTIRSILVLAAAVLVLAIGCSPQQAVTAEEEAGPAQVDEIAGSDVKRVTLTDDAVERIGVETAPVVVSAGHTLVPSSTVLYDQDGRTWVYTEPETDVFIRAEISVIGTDGDMTLLSAGPLADTPVVTVGVAELYGTELGVGDPE